MATVKSQLILETDKARASVKSLISSINNGGKLDLKFDGSSVTKGLSNTLKGANSQLNNLGKETSANFRSSWQNVISYTFGNLLSNALINAGAGLGRFVSDSVRASAEIQKSFTTLEIVAPKFGVDAQAAISTAKKLSKDLGLDYGVAAESLQNLLKSGVDLEQSVDLLKRFSNEALTGKAPTLTYATAVSNLARAFQASNSTLGNNAGITENWTEIRARAALLLEAENGKLKDIKDSLNENQIALLKTVKAGKIRERQLTGEQKNLLNYIGLIDLTNLTLGSAEKFQGTYILEQIKMEQAIKDVQIALGDLLVPALLESFKAFRPLISNTAEFISQLDPASVTNFINTIISLKEEFVAVSAALLGAGLFSGVFKNLLKDVLDTDSNIKKNLGKIFNINAVISSKISMIFLLIKSKVLGGFAFIGASKVGLAFTGLFSGIAGVGGKILPFILAPFKFIGGVLSKVLGVFLLKPILAIFSGLGKALAPLLLKAFGGLFVFLAPIIVALGAFAVLFGFAMAAIKKFNGAGGENKSILDSLKAAYDKFVKDVLPILIQKFQEFVNFWNSTIQPVFDKLLDIILNELSNAFNKFQEILPIVQEKFQQFLDTIKKAQPFLDNLKTGFDNIAYVFNTFLLPVIEDFLSGAWANLVLAFETISPTLATLWESLQRLWEVISPVLIPVLIVLAGIVGGALYLAFVGIAFLFNTLVSVIIFLINTGINVLIAAIELVTATFQVLGAVFSFIWAVIVDLFTNGGKNVGNIFNEFIGKLQKIWEELKPKLIEIAGNIWNGLVETVKTLSKNIGDAFNNVTEAIMEVLRKVNLNQMGQDMIQGLINGVKDMGGKLAGAIGDVVNGGVDWAKKQLGIQSPSTVFRDQIGKQMVAGAVVGVESEEKRFSDAINRVLDVNKIVSNITNNYNRVITNNNNNIFTFNSNGGAGLSVASQYAV